MKETTGREDITWWTHYNRLNLRSGIIQYIFHGWLAGSCSVWQEDDPINQWANQSFPAQRVDLLMAFMGVGNSGIFNGLDFYDQKKETPPQVYQIQNEKKPIDDPDDNK